MTDTARETSDEARLDAFDAVLWASRVPEREVRRLAGIDRQARWRYAAGSAPSLRTIARVAIAVALASSEDPAAIAATLTDDTRRMLGEL